jgi:preprotein translocase subunit SecY
MHGTTTYMIITMILIVFFSFFYNNVVFDTKDMAENLKKSNIFIPGTRPGEATAKLLHDIMNRLSLIGAIYLCIICIIPEYISSQYGSRFMIGGTSLLIIVNVITDTMVAIQPAMLPQKYKKSMRVGGYK